MFPSSQLYVLVNETLNLLSNQFYIYDLENLCQTLKWRLWNCSILKRFQEDVGYLSSLQVLEIDSGSLQKGMPKGRSLITGFCAIGFLEQALWSQGAWIRQPLNMLCDLWYPITCFSLEILHWFFLNTLWFFFFLAYCAKASTKPPLARLVCAHVGMIPIVVNIILALLMISDCLPANFSWCSMLERASKRFVSLLRWFSFFCGHKQRFPCKGSLCNICGHRFAHGHANATRLLMVLVILQRVCHGLAWGFFWNRWKGFSLYHRVTYGRLWNCNIG